MIGRLLRRAPLAIGVSLGGLVAQGYYAGHKMLPHFTDQDHIRVFSYECLKAHCE